MKNNKLKERRISLGLTQQQVARIAGISERGYQNYEMGVRLPNVVVAMQIADALKCKVEDVFCISHAQTDVNLDV